MERLTDIRRTILSVAARPRTVPASAKNADINPSNLYIADDAVHGRDRLHL